MSKLEDPTARVWYAHSAIEHGWSRKLLEHHIATGRREREGWALTNFSQTLPACEREPVQQGALDAPLGHLALDDAR